MALVGVGDLISLVELLVGVGDLINCTRFAYICGFGNSWRFEDTRSIYKSLSLSPYSHDAGRCCYENLQSDLTAVHCDTTRCDACDIAGFDSM